MNISSKLDRQLLKKIQSLRTQHGFSQDYVASQLDISRSTYISLEKNCKSLTITMLEKIVDLYDISFRDLFYSQQQTNIQKFIQMYFRVLSNYPGGIPKTKLAKLLYLIDFTNYYKSGHSISDMVYINRQHGPVAEPFFEITDTLFDSGKIRIELLSEGAFMISRASRENLDGLLDMDEKNLIDQISQAWKGHSTSEIVNYTHEQYPWKTTKNGDEIPYELILEEDEVHLFLPIE